MKIVTALLKPDDTIAAVRRLLNGGIQRESLSLISAAADMPAYLEGDPESGAVQGAAVGAAAGTTMGVLGTTIAAAIPGFESMFVSGLMATAAGGVLGGYLGSLFSVREESQTMMDVHEALEEGDLLLIVKADGSSAQTVVSLLEESRVYSIESHTVAHEEVEE